MQVIIMISNLNYSLIKNSRKSQFLFAMNKFKFEINSNNLL